MNDPEQQMTPEEELAARRADGKARTAKSRAKHRPKLDALRLAAAKRLVKTNEKIKELDATAKSRLKLERESAERARIARERIEDIVYELSGGNVDNSPAENRRVDQKIDDYLRGLEDVEFETLYTRLNFTEVGKAILQHFGIEGLPELPTGWTYLLSGDDVQKFHQPYGPSLPIWDPRGHELMDVYAAKNGVESFSVLPKSPAAQAFDKKYSAPVTRESLQKLAAAVENEEATSSAERRAWQGRLYSLAAKYKNARNRMKAQIAGGSDVN